MTVAQNPFAPRVDLKIWMDGQLVPVADAKVSVFDHGFLYGDGIFEGIRVYGGKIWLCKEHLDRLYASADGIALTMPMDRQAVVDAMNAAIRANDVVDGYIRLLVTRGVGDLGINPTRTGNPSVIVIADTISLYPEKFYKEGMRIIISKYTRTPNTSIPSSIKSMNYLNSILALAECVEAGVPEAVMLDVSGNVAECTGDNIFIVRNGELVTTPLSVGILPGVTRSFVMGLARKAGITVKEAMLKPDDLYVADEFFLTGTAAEIVAVTGIDAHVIGDGKPGPVMQQLLADFREAVKAFVANG